MRVFYFGALGNNSGHGCLESTLGGARNANYYDVVKTLGNGAYVQLDGGLAPQLAPWRHRQGAAALSRRGGFTVLAWWDMTVDGRPASNSAIIAEGEHGFADMLQLLVDHFPAVMARQTSSISIPVAT